MSMLHLTDLVLVNMLQNIIDRFYAVTHITSMVSDYQGNFLTSTSGFNPCCTLFHTNPQNKLLCKQSGAVAGMRSSISHKPNIYLCHCGLVDATIPIFADESYVGMLLVGQVRIKPSDVDRLDYQSPRVSSLNLPPETEREYRCAFDRTPEYSYDEFLERVELLGLFANYITDLSYK